jgi:hypothetical protein
MSTLPTYPPRFSASHARELLRVIRGDLTACAIGLAGGAAYGSTLVMLVDLYLTYVR